MLHIYMGMSEETTELGLSTIIRKATAGGGNYLSPLLMYLTTDIDLKAIAEAHNIPYKSLFQVSKRQNWQVAREAIRNSRLATEIAAIGASNRERIKAMRDLDVDRLQAATDKLHRLYERLVMPDDPRYEQTAKPMRWSMDKAKTYAEAYGKLLSSRYRAAGIADTAPASIDIQILAPQGMLSQFRVRQSGQEALISTGEAAADIPAAYSVHDTPTPTGQNTPPTPAHTLTPSASDAAEKDHFGVDSFLEAYSGA